MYNNRYLKIKINKKLELLSILLILSETKGEIIDCRNYKYKFDILKYFNNYKNHRAVEIIKESNYKKKFERYSKLFFNFDSKFLEIRTYKKIKFSNEDLELILEIRDFIIKSGFDNFYNSNLNFYKKIENNYNNYHINIKYFEKYLGIKNLRKNIINKRNFLYKREFKYKIYISTFYNFLSYNIKIKLPKNKYELNTILSINQIQDNIPKKIMPLQTENYILSTIYHEFLHAIIDILNKYLIDIKKYEKLIIKFRQNENQNVYKKNDFSYFNETIIRALSIRLLENIKKEDVCLLIEKYHNSVGFYDVKEFYDLFENYNYKKLKSFKDFYPSIIKKLDELNKD